MGGMTIGDGLAAIAFWGFVGAIVLAGIWYSARVREARLETLRRMIDTGQPLDQAVRDRLLSLGEDDDGAGLTRALRAAGVVILFAAPGIALLGWLLADTTPWTLPALLGAGLLTAFVGTGLMVASHFVKRD